MRISGMSQNKYGVDYMVSQKSAEKQDSQLKSIGAQINNVQKQMQSLSENEKLSMEEKAKRRKELQEQMQDLNKQMMERQFEIQKEKREKQAQEAEKAAEKQAPKQVKKQEKGTVSQATMSGIISASTAMDQAQTLQSTKTQMEGRVNVLESEIAMDKTRGSSVEKKEQELASLNDRIEKTTGNMMTELAEVSDTLKESQNVEEKKEEKEDEKEKKGTIQGKKSAEESGQSEKVSKKTGSEAEIATENVGNIEGKQSYTPIDIRL